MSEYCEGCGCLGYCKCGEMKITMTDNELSERYVSKRVLRKLVERWRGIIERDAYTCWEDAIEDCADELERLLS